MSDDRRLSWLAGCRRCTVEHKSTLHDTSAALLCLKVKFKLVATINSVGQQPKHVLVFEQQVACSSALRAINAETVSRSNYNLVTNSLPIMVVSRVKDFSKVN